MTTVLEAVRPYDTRLHQAPVLQKLLADKVLTEARHTVIPIGPFALLKWTLACQALACPPSPSNASTGVHFHSQMSHVTAEYVLHCM